MYKGEAGVISSAWTRSFQLKLGYVASDWLLALFFSTGRNRKTVPQTTAKAFSTLRSRSTTRGVGCPPRRGRPCLRPSRRQTAARRACTVSQGGGGRPRDTVNRILVLTRTQSSTLGEKPIVANMHPCAVSETMSSECSAKRMRVWPKQKRRREALKSGSVSNGKCDHGGAGFFCKGEK
jgi:hypothetical protein